jgi:hypothetical protein
MQPQFCFNLSGMIFQKLKTGQDRTGLRKVKEIERRTEKGTRRTWV